MKLIFDFVKKYKWLILVLVLLFGIGTFFYLRRVPVGILPQTRASYKSLTPGVSTKDEVIQKLGNPVKTEQVGSTSVFSFDSKSPTRDNKVTIENGTVQIIKEIVAYGETRKIDEIKKVYGDATNVLYGQDAQSGFYLFVYLERGIAYIGNPETGDLLEIWYFPPTDIKNFKSLWAPNYNDKLPIQQ